MENKESTSKPAKKVSRRSFLKGAAAVAGTAVLGGLTEQLAQAAGTETPTATGTPTAKAATSVPASKSAAVSTAEARVATREAQFEKAKRAAEEEAAVHARETAIEGKFQALTPSSTPSITPSPIPSNTPTPANTPDALGTARAWDKTAVEIVADRKETAIAKTPSATPVPSATEMPGERGGQGVRIDGIEVPQRVVDVATGVAIPVGSGVLGLLLRGPIRRGVRGIRRAWTRMRGGAIPPAGPPAPPAAPPAP